MGALQVGIVEASRAAALIEADWRNTLPADWSISVPFTVDSLTQTATGAYVSGTTDTGYYEFGSSPGQMQAATLMIQFNVAAWSAFYGSISGQSDNYYECGVYGNNVDEATSATLASQGGSADFTSLGSASMTIVAITMSNSGTAKVYLIKNDAATAVNTDATLSPGTLSDLTVVTFVAAVRDGMNLGVPGDVRVVHTLLAPNREYSQSEIETVATQWGWVPDDVDQYENNWTAQSLPSGWSTIGNGTAVYAAGGTYNSDATNTTKSLELRRTITSRSYNKLTVMFAVDVSGTSDHSFELLVGNSLLTFYRETTGVDTTAFDTHITGNGYSHTSTGTGMIILAATLNSNGTMASYMLDIGAATQVLGGSIGPNPSPNESGITDIGIVMRPWDPVNEVLGTPGDLKVLRSYVGFDEVLSQAQIETKAGTWGWS